MSRSPHARSAKPRKASTEGRVARRRHRMREALLHAAARQFAARGIATVSVEELLAEADVSRATFYGMFSNKYSVLDDILNPIFETAIAAIEALAKESAGAGLEGIFRVYTELWREHREGLLLIPTVDASTFERFETQHRALNEALLVVLTKAERADLLRNGSASYSLRVLARTSIPLLKVYDGHPAGAALFVDGMKALLMNSD